MLREDIFKQGIQDLLDYYPTWGLDYDNPEVVRKWYRVFEVMDDTEFIRCYKKQIETIPYNPTVASLLSIHENITKRSIYD